MTKVEKSIFIVGKDDIVGYSDIILERGNMFITAVRVDLSIFKIFVYDINYSNFFYKYILNIYFHLFKISL